MKVKKLLLSVLSVLCLGFSSVALVSCGEQPNEQPTEQPHVHKWNEGELTKDPTCSTTGEMTYTCSGCGETKVEETPALEHNFVDNVCSKCGYYYTEGLVFTLSEDGESYSVTNYVGTDTEVIIPAIYNKLPVTSIGFSSFQNCISLTSITIPDGVTSIGHLAFFGCSSLESITIPDSITSINGRAFDFCISLKYNTYDNGLYLGNKNNPYVVLVKENGTDITTCKVNESTKIIGNYAFNYRSSLTSITIPDGVTSIGVCAFQNCSSLTSITIPDSVTYIGGDAFQNCSSLTYNTYDNGLYLGNKNNPYVVLVKGNGTQITTCKVNESTKIIGNNAFAGCSSLESVTIGNSVTSVGYGVFEACISLTSIVIPDNVTYVSDSAFYGCSSLTSVVIPDSVTSIGIKAFMGCSSLTSVVIPDSVTSIGSSAFSMCSSLTSITIPDGVTRIDGYAFGGCSSLISITIPDSVTIIDGCAFQNCSSLTSITIPDSITTIGHYAFEGCNSLINVYHTGTEEQWNNIFIGDNNEDLTKANIHYNYVE